MKIKTLKEIDLSKYKLAMYHGNSFGSFDFTQDTIMKMSDSKIPTDIDALHIALIPKNKRLQDCGGDDWNDMCANDNASGFYDFPKGTIFLKGELGEELELLDDI